MRKIFLFPALTWLLFPSVSLAAVSCSRLNSTPGTICWVIDQVDQILPILIQTLFVLATVVFIWGLITYITAGGSEDKIVKGRKYMLWGIIGLTVMVAIWGIVRVFITTFEIGGQGIPTGPGKP